MDGTYIVPADILEQLISLAFGPMVFSDKNYLSQNPDIAAAITRKELASALQHFIWSGIKEKRELSYKPFDPKRYLQLNPDLADSLPSTSAESLTDHWMTVGWLEGRPTN